VRQLVLLRGVNLGPRNRIAMPELRAAFAQAGWEDVRTYVQSGNVVVGSELAPGELSQQVQRLLADRFGLEVKVLVRTRDELAEVVRRNPLGDVAVDPKRYQVSFLDAELDAEQVRALAAYATARERVVAIGRELYAWHPDGVARSKLWSRLAGRDLPVTATSRNWTTVCALLAMADE
jgi:uncharacterized protein (DUF1697 family)